MDDVVVSRDGGKRVDLKHSFNVDTLRIDGVDVAGRREINVDSTFLVLLVIWMILSLAEVWGSLMEKLITDRKLRYILLAHFDWDEF